MKMVINHLLSAKDKEAIEKASQESINKVFDLTDVVSLGRVLDEYDVCKTLNISPDKLDKYLQ